MTDMAMTMKAARLHRVGEFTVDTVPVPIPKGKELLVRVGACGICGSDLPRVYINGTSTNIYPLTLGHEFSGTIVAVGPEADPSLIGRRGAFFPLIPCRRCTLCLSGHYAMCENYNYMGSRCDGGFAEYCLVPSSWHFIEAHNTDTTFEELAMVEPACVAQHAIRKGQVFAGANIVIFGAGPIGIMAGRWARLTGANVLMADVLDQKVAFAEKCGFPALNSCEDSFFESMKRCFEGSQADVAIEGSGYSSALENSIRCLKPFGHLVLLGNPTGNTQIAQKLHSQILRKELTINGVWNSHFGNLPINEWRYTVEMIENGSFLCSDLVSDRTDLDGLPALMEAIHNKAVTICKALYAATG